MIIGLGEDGPAGLPDASRQALAEAEVIFGGPRHLELVGAGARGQAWPVPFDVAPVLAQHGRRVVVLASGDPFWHGAGGSLVPHLGPGEWVSHPVPSVASRIANRLGWRLEGVACHGLHAAPFAQLLPDLHNGARLICTLRDGVAPGALAEWLVTQGFGLSTLHVIEAEGGPRARLRVAEARGFALDGIALPVAVAIEARGQGLPRSPGLPDARFAHDGQITKSPIRAMTIAALAPRPGERLWDIGAGSGSVSVEWCLAGGFSSAVEARADRVANIRANIDAFGLAPRLTVTEGVAPGVLAGLPLPDAVFVGGGLDTAVLEALWRLMPAGARLVANAVTLETEALMVAGQAQHGGTLTRIAIANAAPLGQMRGWVAARPVVQWSMIR